MSAILQAVRWVQAETCPTQAVLPWVGLAADKVVRDQYILMAKIAHVVFPKR
ncbi:MAG: hypothetical protein R6U98_20115 [Pirellulaceae bacterium]